MNELDEKLSITPIAQVLFLTALVFVLAALPTVALPMTINVAAIAVTKKLRIPGLR
jgi:multisubunit Na+/H+ antiporter MnhC subunit